MKSVFLTLAFVLVAACGRSPTMITPQPGPPGPGPQPKPKPIGFTAHPWCYVYNNGQQNVEDRFMFNTGGNLNYQKSAWLGQRGPILGQANGTWTLNGTVLQMVMNGQRLVFQTQYDAVDPVTGIERVHMFMNGQDLPYDPCL